MKDHGKCWLYLGIFAGWREATQREGHAGERWLGDVTEWGKKELHTLTELTKNIDQWQQMVKDAIDIYGQWTYRAQEEDEKTYYLMYNNYFCIKYWRFQISWPVLLIYFLLLRISSSCVSDYDSSRINYSLILCINCLYRVCVFVFAVTLLCTCVVSPSLCIVWHSFCCFWCAVIYHRSRRHFYSHLPKRKPVLTERLTE